jgi:hypothetical protein
MQVIPGRRYAHLNLISTFLLAYLSHVVYQFEQLSAYVIYVFTTCLLSMVRFLETNCKLIRLFLLEMERFIDIYQCFYWYVFLRKKRKHIPIYVLEMVGIRLRHKSSTYQCAFTCLFLSPI